MSKEGSRISFPFTSFTPSAATAKQIFGTSVSKTFPMEADKCPAIVQAIQSYASSTNQRPALITVDVPAATPASTLDACLEKITLMLSSGTGGKFVMALVGTPAPAAPRAAASSAHTLAADESTAFLEAATRFKVASPEQAAGPQYITSNVIVALTAGALLLSIAFLGFYFTLSIESPPRLAHPSQVLAPTREY